MIYSYEEGKLAVKCARDVIEKYVRGEEVAEQMPKKFDAKSGVFVTINTHPTKELRGCIGYPEPTFSLSQALIESAKSASRDPRFLPLKAEELDNIMVEVTILTPPELIEVKSPKEYAAKIEIGKDGLIVERGLNKGLLLPQVAVEQHWDKEEFLSHTCMKAGLMPDAWLARGTKIYKFKGQIFAEKEPRGEVVERKIGEKE